jgi:hypothetical protein
MGKTIQKRKLSPLKIVIIILAVFIGLPVVFILGSLVVHFLILQPIDRAKFESLDKDSRALFATVQQISNGSEPWVYDASCEPDRAGPWATGAYFCTTKMSFEVSVTDALTVASLHTKYFPTIDAAGWLKPETELSKLPIGEFGVNFVVSGAEKFYIAQVDVDCTYLMKLAQPFDKFNRLPYTYGSPVSGATGRIIANVECTGLTSGDWYAL